MRRTLLLAALGAAALSLGACGKVGELERPAPMWGDQAKAEYQAQQRAAAAKAHSTVPAIPATLPDDAQPRTSDPSTASPTPPP